MKQGKKIWYYVLGSAILIILVLKKTKIDFFSKNNVRNVIDDLRRTQEKNYVDQSKVNMSISALHTAMVGRGTNEKAIYEALRTLDVDEVKQLYIDWGLRPYPTLFGSKDLDLIGWLSEELEYQSEKDSVNKYLLPAGLKVV